MSLSKPLMVPSRTVTRRPLADLAFTDREFTTLRLTRSSRFARQLARWLTIGMFLSVVGLVFIPWQQTVIGSGEVVAYDPSLRPQTVDAPISGRIVNWREGDYEGAYVEKGQILFDIEVVDVILKEQLALQLRAMQEKLEADKTVARAYESNLQAFRDVRYQAEIAARELVKMAEAKIDSEKAELEVAKAESEQADRNLARAKELLEGKVGTKQDWETADQKAKQAKQKVQAAKAKVAAAMNELDYKKADAQYKIREAEAKISSAEATFREAEGKIASTDKEIADLTSKQVLQSQPVRAPIAGYIFKMKVTPGGQFVTSGSSLFDIVPDTPDRAVAIKVNGNDVPLVATHNSDGSVRKVRLQFEGWPAVQFAGWPSAAVGTFGGVVTVVDSSSDGTGNFRLLVRPDPEDKPWPDERILRQGVRANAWVLLNRVPLGWELWRRVNGFPPVVASAEPTKEKVEEILRKKK